MPTNRNLQTVVSAEVVLSTTTSAGLSNACPEKPKAFSAVVGVIRLTENDFTDKNSEEFS